MPAAGGAHLHAEFGAGIAAMVEKLTLRQDRAEAAAGADLAVITIADRLHNLRTIRPLRAARRERVALDTLVPRTVCPGG